VAASSFRTLSSGVSLSCSISNVKSIPYFCAASILLPGAGFRSFSAARSNSSGVNARSSFTPQVYLLRTNQTEFQTSDFAVPGVDGKVPRIIANRARAQHNRTMQSASFGKFRVGLVQMSCAPDPNENLEKAKWKIREAAAGGAQIICLQELFRSQYFCREENAELFALAESIPGPTTETLGALARELEIVVIASLFERRGSGLYHNTAAVIGTDGAIAGIYRKMHIPDDPLYFEKFYFTPGDLGFLNFETSFARIGVLVCWDQWYPEAARLSSIGGANVLFYPTAIGWHPAEKQQYGAAQLDAWRTIQRAHAIANGIYVAAVNRVGFEGPPERGLEFWGSSFVADPFGQVIAQAPTSEEAILIAQCDPHRVEEVRRNWPFLRDRRIDAYAPILKRWLD